MRIVSPSPLPSAGSSASAAGRGSSRRRVAPTPVHQVSTLGCRPLYERLGSHQNEHRRLGYNAMVVLQGQKPCRSDKVWAVMRSETVCSVWSVSGPVLQGELMTAIGSYQILSTTLLIAGAAGCDFHGVTTGPTEGQIRPQGDSHTCGPASGQQELCSSSSSRMHRPFCLCRQPGPGQRQHSI